jgi:hypothetical protein
MCCIAVKYLPKYGWLGAKNRDRNYETSINIVKSNLDSFQRIYIDDATTRWTEGVNENGIAIISASFSVKSDEKEGGKVLSNKKKKAIVSPDGLAIRNALREKNVHAAAEYLIGKKLAGATFIFDEKTCLLLEGGFTVKKQDSTKENPREYIHNLKEIKQKEGHCVRTNHGIDLKQLGYSSQSKDPKIIESRKSSESRWKILNDGLGKSNIVGPLDFLEIMSNKSKKDSFMNPVRTGNPKKGDMVTTGQLLINAKEKTLHYRPIYSSVTFNYDKLNDNKSKVFFEIISNRKLLSFKEHYVQDDRLIENAYFTGLSKSTIEKKKAQMKKQAAMDSDDPSAYKTMPGDVKGRKTSKISKHTKKYKDLFGAKEESLEEKSTSRSPINNSNIEAALKKKSKASGFPIGILRAVMRRGMGAWKSGHRPGASQEQWGYARTNSFITKSPGTWGKADADLAAEIKK